MTANEAPESTLLILDRSQEIIPLSTAAFVVAQLVGSTKNEAKLKEKVEGALVIYRNGNVVRVERITVLGFAGNTLLAKIESILTRMKRIRVDLSPVRDVTFDDLKKLIMRCVELDRNDAEPYLPNRKPLARILDEIRACTTCEAIFDVLEVPEPQDCLDLL